MRFTCSFFFCLLLFIGVAHAKNAVKVIDGDTIHIGSKKYRFSGIDTPEMKQTCKKDNQIVMCGVIAKNALVKKINKQQVNCKEEEIDRYKRIVAECFVNKGTVINGLDKAAKIAGSLIFHAGTATNANGDVIATGGRVLNVTANAATIGEAQERAYKAVDRIEWPEGFCRRDIGWRAV